MSKSEYFLKNGLSPNIIIVLTIIIKKILNIKIKTDYFYKFVEVNKRKREQVFGKRKKKLYIYENG